MQKLMFLIGMVTALSLALKSDPPAYKTFLQRENINGKIASITETTYLTSEEHGQILKKNETIKETTVYNNSGDVTERVSTSQYNAAFKYNYINKHAANGKLMETTWHNDYGSGLLTYDEKGHIKTLESYKEDGSLNYKNTLKFNRKDQLIQFYSIDTLGNKHLSQTYEYDDKGFMIREMNYDKDSNNSYTVNFNYTAFDKQGNWTTRIRYGSFIKGHLKISPTITEREIQYLE